MSGIDAITQATAQTSFESAAGASAEAMDRDTFLNLLTTQLQNQDPLNPMDSEAFVSQLATFSSLEQLMGIQSSLDAVYMGIASMNNASMADLLGTEVLAVGDGVHLDGEGDPIDLQYYAAGDVASATLAVMDEDGHVVYTEEVGALSEGEGTLEWDGTDLDGNPLPEGDYTFSITGTDSDGNDVSIEERIKGKVTEMDYASGTPQPSIEGVVISLADIIRLTTGEEG